MHVCTCTCICVNACVRTLCVRAHKCVRQHALVGVRVCAGAFVRACVCLCVFTRTCAFKGLGRAPQYPSDSGHAATRPTDLVMRFILIIEKLMQLAGQHVTGKLLLTTLSVARPQCRPAAVAQQPAAGLSDPNLGLGPELRASTRCKPMKDWAAPLLLTR
jgi:hypothetical protein